MPDQTVTPNSTQQDPEDSFFVLRDCREFFQRKLVEIARLAGISTPAIIDALTRNFGEVHDELAASDQQDGFEQTAGLTASRISLVGLDDLELEIRIGEIANRLKGNERIDRWRVQLRYMTLLHRPQMAADSNPIGLEPICRGLWAVCRASENSLEQNFSLLGRLEEQLQAQLPDIYAQLSDLLASHGVDPAPVPRIQRTAGGRTAADPGYGASGSSAAAYGEAGREMTGSNALSILQQSLNRQHAGGDVLFDERSPGHVTGASGVLNASTLVMLNHLMDRLNALELQQGRGTADEARTDGKSPLRAIRSNDLDLPLGKPAAVALDTLSLIFEAIFATADLADVVKAAISRLQIPLLKLALLDPSFFADTQHPGRRLVNRMARAAVGLAQNTGRDHPVCRRIASTADAARMTLEKGDGNLSAHLDELDKLIAERDQSLKASAQPYLQLILDHEAREASATSAQEWLFEMLGQTTHPQIASFLSSYWVRLMQKAFLEGGKTGASWKTHASTCEELLRSVSSRQTPEERKELLPRIPSLLKRLNDGLDRLEISSPERTLFLNTCFHLQTAALRGRPEAQDTEQYTRPAAPAPTALAAAAPRMLERKGTRVHYQGMPSAVQSPWRSSNPTWKEGDWIEFQLPDGRRRCGRHCGQAVTTGTVLLLNEQWGYAAALAPSLLEQQLRARVVSERSLFDDAAERASSQISPG